ncbi:hypothetical protein [Bordetella sp. LUAb4]|uniref:hypothetical protein n=1 Tax=Bordetella sp. LUAb4 TaxID=2843195 RepID=UPI001E546AEA|nr:hypothetical protein [Bordetella sp. LUAb4]
MSTYEAAVDCAPQGDHAALDLYAWNAQVAAAFLAPLHICEVTLRNAVAAAIEAKYGENWPWSAGFEQSLATPLRGYNSRKDLFSARQPFQVGQVGKVIAESKFMFWQSMFTKRHDHRIWNQQLMRVLPFLDSTKSVADLRSSLFESLEKLRRLRNRIAHHEPIFTRDLALDLSLTHQLIGYRSKAAAAWMLKHQHVSVLLSSRPRIRACRA